MNIIKREKKYCSSYSRKGLFMVNNQEISDGSEAGSVNTEKNLQLMLQLVPDILHLSDSKRVQITKLFGEYLSFERMVHFIHDNADEPEDDEENREVRKYLMEEFFYEANGHPGKLIAPGIQKATEESLRTLSMPIDRIIKSPKYVFFHLGLPHDIFDSNDWRLPDGTQAFMAFILSPQAKQIPSIRAFNASDTGGFKNVPLNWDNVSKLILSVDTLNHLREELLLRGGPENGFFDRPNPVLPTSEYTYYNDLDRPHSIFDSREVKVRDGVQPEFVEAIVLRHKGDIALFKDYRGVKMGDKKLRDIVFTYDDYKALHKEGDLGAARIRQ